MRIVENPKEYEKTIEYWDKGDGRTNALQSGKQMFSSDIDVVIRDSRISIPAGKSVVLQDILAEDLVKKFPHLTTKEYVEPVLEKKPKISSKRTSRKKKNAKKK
uniref:Uncharacterized protein n=1 Tax=viral metagenome TaxID=1070528 RepID=A0A6H1ZKV0_9ZZZZ